MAKARVYRRGQAWRAFVPGVAPYRLAVVGAYPTWEDAYQAAYRAMSRR
jgi:hypothetical protein